MLVVCPTLQIDVLKMEQACHDGTSHGLVELLTTMTELNKYVFEPFFVFTLN
jgi:hypothetical protein